MDTEEVREKIVKFDFSLIHFLRQYSTPFLRYSLGGIFIWLGLLKPLGMSPAEELISQTVYVVPPEYFIPVLGVWEVIIGICLIYRPLLRVGIFFMIPQMIGTFLPMLILPSVVYTFFPFGLTLEGQYIVKNIVLITAALVIGSSVKPLENAE